MKSALKAMTEAQKAEESRILIKKVICTIIRGKLERFGLTAFRDGRVPEKSKCFCISHYAGRSEH